MDAEQSSGGSLGRRIARLRDERHWSAQDLADRCRDAGFPALTRGKLTKIENGHRRTMSVDELMVLARVFRMSLDELVQVDKMTPPSSVATDPVPGPVGSSRTSQGSRTSDDDGVRRIGLVEDHQMVAAGLMSALSSRTDLQLVTQATTVSGLLSQTTDLDLVLLDLRLADDSSPADNVELLREHGLPALVFTSGEDVYAVRNAVRTGVLGVVLKSDPTERLVEAIGQAASGRVVYTEEWAAAVDGDPGFESVRMSPRQRQVLSLYASGMRASEVAQAVGLTEETVNAYLGRIRQRYEEAGRPARTKTELYKRALEDGWLPIPRRRR